MDWSSITRYHGAVMILVGFAFLLNPLVVSANDIGDPDRYQYESSAVEFYDNGTYMYETKALPLDSDVACFGDLPSRSCILERAIYTNDGITFDGPPRNFMHHEYSYIHIWGEGFFQPITEDGPNETVRYGHQAVPREEALRYIATPLSRTNQGVQTAIKTDTYETSDEVEGTHELVQAGDDYHVVYTAESTEYRNSERSTTVIALQWLLGGTGAFLILRGQRHRVERQWRE